MLAPEENEYGHYGQQRAGEQGHSCDPFFQLNESIRLLGLNLLLLRFFSSLRKSL
jgi:hypothetical protein